MGFFVIIIKNPDQPTIESAYIIFTGLGTSISMFISGLSGSYLSERAEQRKNRIELNRAMGSIENLDEGIVEPEELEKAMVVPPVILDKKLKKKLSFKNLKKEDKKKVRTLHEKAETFTGLVVSFVNGVSPLLGGIVPIIPFFFVTKAGFSVFLTSFTIIVICIVFLGIFLGRISNESIIKNVLQMAGAFTVTMIVTILFLGI